MISEEKVKIMAEMAKYEKNYGKGDFRIYKYTKKDYVRSEKIKTSIALLISFLIMTGLLCIMQLDIVIMKLREGKVIVSAAVIIGIYVAVFFVYLHFTKMRASRQYDEVRARVLIYDKHLEELETLYKEKVAGLTLDNLFVIKTDTYSINDYVVIGYVDNKLTNSFILCKNTKKGV